MAAAERRYGPQVGSEVYEKLRSDFMPLNPPVDEWCLDPFVVPMPSEEFNLPHVSLTIQWEDQADIDPTKRGLVEHVIGTFYGRATIQGVADDIAQVEVYRFDPVDGEEPPMSTWIAPVIKGSSQVFENDFERWIFMHKVGRSFGTVMERAHMRLMGNGIQTEGMLQRFEEDFSTLESRLKSYRYPATLLATARLVRADQQTSTHPLVDELVEKAADEMSEHEWLPDLEGLNPSQN